MYHESGHGCPRKSCPEVLLYRTLPLFEGLFSQNFAPQRLPRSKKKSEKGKESERLGKKNPW